MAAQAFIAGQDLAVASNVEGGRITIDAVGITYVVGSENNRVVDAHVLSEFRNLLLARIIHRDANDREPLGTILFLQVDEVGYLCFAGWAPRRPEVQNDGFAFQVRKPHKLASADFLQLEIRRGGASNLAYEPCATSARTVPRDDDH